MDLFLQWPHDAGAPIHVGAIYSYGFGDSMDAQGRVAIANAPGRIDVERPPAFDAFVELPPDLAEQVARRAGARLTGVLEGVPAGGATGGEHRPPFQVARILAETP
jgi:hypothetical protein